MKRTDALGLIGLIIDRDLKLASRRRGQILHPLLFLTLLVILFPLALGPEPAQLRAVAAGVLWVGALVAVTMTLGELYRDDLEDGTLEQFVVSGQPLSLICFSRAIAHWVITALPLLLLTPVFAALLNLDMDLLPIMLLSLALGTPTLSLIGNVIAALTVGIGRAGLLVGLLAMPLYVPVLIFATGAVNASQAGLAPTGHLLMLAAIATLALTLAPVGAAAALRTGLE